MISHPRQNRFLALILFASVSLLAMAGPPPMLQAQTEEKKPGIVTFMGISANDDVYVDDMPASHGPMSSHTLSAGWHRITLLNAAADRTTADWFLIGESDTTVLTAHMNHVSPRSFVPSLIVPGLSQFLQGSRTVGTTLFAAAVGTGIWALQAQKAYNDKRSAYGDARSLYVGARTEAEAVDRRQPMLSAHDDMIKTRNLSNAAIITFGAVYLFNVAHTFLYHAEGDDIEIVPRVTTVSTPDGAVNGLSFGVHIPL